MKDLSKAEEMILLTIMRLKDNAYGVAVKKELQKIVNKEYTYGTLYGLFDQLVQKEYVYKIKGGPTPERGGKSKTFYRLTPEGLQALKNSLEVHQKIWQGIDKLSLGEA